MSIAKDNVPIQTQEISITDVDKIRRAYNELITARFNNISVKDMVPLVMTISLLSEVIRNLDASAPTSKTPTKGGTTALT